ncbi:hypothetical protein L1987_58014 [Smallanthus sonchifolius]|uniref:Uncharacterized protein n=1 Tax=Smallanthus sonchifolius TaxID=185202 RepID=A0ACB9DEK3_9ASTR|nr:hypothetical protein L1987_58014 [Smallanthus sonchifolius]
MIVQSYSAKQNSEQKDTQWMMKNRSTLLHQVSSLPKSTISSKNKMKKNMLTLQKPKVTERKYRSTNIIKRYFKRERLLGILFLNNSSQHVDDFNEADYDLFADQNPKKRTRAKARKYLAAYFVQQHTSCSSILHPVAYLKYAVPGRILEVCGPGPGPPNTFVFVINSLSCNSIHVRQVGQLR